MSWDFLLWGNNHGAWPVGTLYTVNHEGTVSVGQVRELIPFQPDRALDEGQLLQDDTWDRVLTFCLLTCPLKLPALVTYLAN